LIEEEPAYDILVTNPPYALKYQFIEKTIKSSKPFALLLPLACITTKKWYNICGNFNLHFQILTPSPSFLHAGRMVQVGEIVWVYGNIRLQSNTLSYFNMSALRKKDDELARLMEDTWSIAK
jgi:hypothetical protein